MLHGMTKQKIKELAYSFAKKRVKKFLRVGKKTELQGKTGSKYLERGENESRYDSLKPPALPVPWALTKLMFSLFWQCKTVVWRKRRIFTLKPVELGRDGYLNITKTIKNSWPKRHKASWTNNIRRKRFDSNNVCLCKCHRKRFIPSIHISSSPLQGPYAQWSTREELGIGN